MLNLPFPSAVDYISQSSPPWPIHLGWPYTMWLSFTELDKAVVHVIRLGSCLWLWFQSVCPLTSSLSAYHLTGVSLTLDVGVSLHSCSSKVQLLLLTLDLGYLLTATATDLGCGVSSHDKMWSTGEGNGKPLPYSCLEIPMNSMKRRKDRTLKDELPSLVVPNMLLEISGEITTERMKGWSQSKNKTRCGCDWW